MEKMPRKEYAKSLPVKIEVDQEQFSKLHLQRWIDSESDSTDTVYNRRRKVMLKRAEQDFAAYQIMNGKLVEWKKKKRNVKHVGRLKKKMSEMLDVKKMTSANA